MKAVELLVGSYIVNGKAVRVTRVKGSREHRAYVEGERVGGEHASKAAAMKAIREAT